MANEKRVRNNNVQGTVAVAMNSTVTTLRSAGLVNLEAISSTEHAAIIIDPGRTAGAPEIVHVTAHTASSTSATVTRAREGTAARAHSATEQWVHAPTAGTDYIAFRPPKVKVRSSVDQDIANNTNTTVTFNTELFDTDSMWSSTASGRIDINTAGTYLVGGNVRLSDGSTAGDRRLGIRRTGATFVANIIQEASTQVSDMAVVALSTASATDYFEMVVVQVSGTTAVDSLAINEYAPSFWAIWQSS